MSRQVYITRVGCLTANGYGPASLLEGRPGSGFREVPDFDPNQYVKMKGLRNLSRASLFGVVSAAAALEKTELAEDRGRRAVVLGTSWASLEPLVDFNTVALTDGPTLVNPAHFPNVVANAHAGYLSILFELAGPNLTLCGPTAGLDAIGQAFDLLQLGRADYVLAGGVETVGSALRQGLARRHNLEGRGEGAAMLGLTAASEPPAKALARLTAWDSRWPASNDLAEERRQLIASVNGESASLVCFCQPTLPPALERPLADAKKVHLPSLTGDCGAANGALAATLATHLITTGQSSVLVLNFPPTGAQSAFLFSQM